MKLVKLKTSSPALALTAALLLGSLGVAACNDSPATAVPASDNPARQVRVVAAAETEAARVVSASGTLAGGGPASLWWEGGRRV